MQALVFGIGTTVFEHSGFLLLAYMQVAKLRVLESTSSVQARWQGRLPCICRGIVISLVLRTVTVPMQGVTVMSTLSGTDLIPTFHGLWEGRHVHTGAMSAMLLITTIIYAPATMFYGYYTWWSSRMHSQSRCSGHGNVSRATMSRAPTSDGC